MNRGNRDVILGVVAAMAIISIALVICIPPADDKEGVVDNNVYFSAESIEVSDKLTLNGREIPIISDLILSEFNESDWWCEPYFVSSHFRWATVTYLVSTERDTISTSELPLIETYGRSYNYYDDGSHSSYPEDDSFNAFETMEEKNIPVDKTLTLTLHYLVPVICNERFEDIENENVTLNDILIIAESGWILRQ